MKNNFLFLLFAFCLSSYLSLSQPQNKAWVVAESTDDMAITFNPGPTASPLLCPNASVVLESTNSIQDASGDVLFYVHDGGVFDKNSLMFDQIISPFPVGGARTIGYPEIVILPVPGNCNQYFIIGGTPQILQTQTENPAPIYVILDLTLPNPNYFPGNGYTQFGAFTVGPTGVPLPNYPNTAAHVKTLHLGATKLRPNTNFTKRFIFISENSNLFRYDFDAGGISNYVSLGALPAGNNSNPNRSELEVVDNPAGGYRLAVSGCSVPHSLESFSLTLSCV